MKRRVITNITVVMKKGSIFENKDINIQAKTFNVLDFSIKDDILYFTAKLAVEKKDATGKIITDEKGPVFEKPFYENREILLEEIAVLAVEGVLIFPKPKQEDEDVF